MTGPQRLGGELWKYASISLFKYKFLSYSVKISLESGLQIKMYSINHKSITTVTTQKVIDGKPAKEIKQLQLTVE